MWESLNHHCTAARLKEKEVGEALQAGFSLHLGKWLISCNSTFLLNENEPSVGGTCPCMQTYINTQTCTHTFPDDYSQTNSQAFSSTHTHKKSCTLTPREHSAGSGGSAGCLHWVVAMQMLPGGSTLFCVCVCLCSLASCDGQLPILPRPWQLPRWLTQIDTAREERSAHTRTRFDTHTLVYTCVGTLRTGMLMRSHQSR